LSYGIPYLQLSIDDLARNNIDFDTDTFKAMLVTSSYTPNKDTHDKRDDVTNEVAGTGYTAGGVPQPAPLPKTPPTTRLRFSLQQCHGQ
jgi:hypothetical protein